MQYFYDSNKTKSAAHLWNEGDTYCRMLSTGGMKLGKKEVQSDLDGRRVCVMCSNNYLNEQFKNQVEN